MPQNRITDWALIKRSCMKPVWNQVWNRRPPSSTENCFLVTTISITNNCWVCFPIIRSKLRICLIALMRNGSGVDGTGVGWLVSKAKRGRIHTGFLVVTSWASASSARFCQCLRCDTCSSSRAKTTAEKRQDSEPVSTNRYIYTLDGQTDKYVTKVWNQGMKPARKIKP